MHTNKGLIRTGFYVSLVIEGPVQRLGMIDVGDDVDYQLLRIMMARVHHSRESDHVCAHVLELLISVLELLQACVS